MKYKVAFGAAAIVIVPLLLLNPNFKFNLASVGFGITTIYILGSAFVGLNFIVQMMKDYKVDVRLIVAAELLGMVLLIMSPVLLSLAGAYKIALDQTIHQHKVKKNGKSPKT